MSSTSWRLLFLALLGVLSCGGSSELADITEVARHGGSIKVRQDACAQIPETGDSEAVDVLIGFLDDEVLWYCAAHGLGQLRDPRAVDPLLVRARRRDERAHVMVWALGEIQDRRTLPELEAIARALQPTTDQERRLQESLERAIARISAG